MTLLERVEKLESQMETQNYRHCLANKELSAQKRRIHEYTETVKEDMKDAKIITDYMNKVMKSKMKSTFQDIQEYTEKAVEGLQKKTKIMNATVNKCVESCTETLEVIKGEERGRSIALDNLIRKNKEKNH